MQKESTSTREIVAHVREPKQAFAQSTRDSNSYRIRLEVTQRKMREKVVERRRAPDKVRVVARRRAPDKVADEILARRSLQEEVVAGRRTTKRKFVAGFVFKNKR